MHFKLRAKTLDDVFALCEEDASVITVDEGYIEDWVAVKKNVRGRWAT